MASMDPSLILQAGQTADVFGALERGNALAQQVNQQRQQNALAGFMRDNGAALMQGDQNALAQFAQYDPMAAFDMMNRQQDRQWRQEDRSYQRERDQRQDSRQDQEWQWKVQEYAAQKSAAERAAEAQQIEDAVKMGLAAPDAATWDAMVTQAGAPDLVGQFDNRQAIGNRYLSVAEILKGQQPGSGAEYGLNPIYGRDPDGNVTIMQLGKDGRAVTTKMPEGVTPDLGVQSQERAAGTARGKAEGEAQSQLPGAYTEANHVIGMVDELIADPYLKDMVGPVNSRLPNASGDAARVQSRMDQVAGQGFMAARQFLKGQGQITDFESRRAEAAMARLNAAQSYGDYVDALREFQDAVRVGVMKAELAAKQAPTGGENAQQPTRRRWTPDGGLK